MTMVIFDDEYAGYNPGDLADVVYSEAVRMTNLKHPRTGKPIVRLATEQEINAAAKPRAAAPVAVTRLVRIVADNYGPYAPGDIAGFPEMVARSLIERGIATPHGAEDTGNSPPRSSYNARAHMLANLDGTKGDDLAAAHIRFLGSDPGRKTDTEIRSAIRTAFAPKSSPMKSTKTGKAPVPLKK